VFLDTLGYRQAATAQEGPGALEPGVRRTGLAPPLSLYSPASGVLHGGDGGTKFCTMSSYGPQLFIIGNVYVSETCSWLKGVVLYIYIYISCVVR
jgi:hypothetical protein